MIKLEITEQTADELLEKLAQLYQRVSLGETAPSAPTPPAPPAAPAPAPAPTSPPPPAAPVAPSVPLSRPPEYSQEQLAVAGTQLLDQGKEEALMGLLAQFGVSALTQLPPGQYGAFATALRGLGAQI